ncbi:MAG: enoyl-CoA hydratase [Ilumatobacter sp.]
MIDDFPDRAFGSDDVVVLESSERIATITINRPEKRNALSSEVLAKVPAAMRRAEHDDDIDVIILTGADPAFTAGLDLHELGSADSGLLDGSGAGGGDNEHDVRGPFPPLTKPLIGAINGVAVTGGLEYALACDFLVASEHAKFGDTHARVGVMPGWGLTVLLPQAIGVRRAREMSFTGNFLTAEEAHHHGLVNHVVPHAELMPFTRQLALDITGNQQDGVRQIRSTYASVTDDTAAWDIETRDGRAWRRARFDPELVAERREGIRERGKRQ